MLLNEKEVQVEIANSLNKCKETVIVLSAFIKHQAFQWFREQIKASDIKVTVVARWRLGDLIVGASDLSVYEQCKERGWTFKVDERLHAKLFLIDSSAVFIGSSNLTGAGLGLAEKSNFELSTKIKAEDADVDRLSKYVDSCTTMTDDLYNQMKEVVDNIDTVKKVHHKWPASIKNILEERVDYLWVGELLFTSPKGNSTQDEIKHDLLLLDLESLDVDRDLLREQFLKLKIAKWLLQKLKNEESKTLKFGAITRCLHNALLDDPSPYRKEVKDFQVNLFNWIKYLNLSEFKIDKHNYSESISLIDY